jgi:hypothetical protein
VHTHTFFRSHCNFSDLDQDCLLKPVKWFLSHNDQRGSLLVCNWLYSVGQNHLYVMMLFIQGSCFIQSLHPSFRTSRRLCEDFKAVKFGSLATIRTMWYPVRSLNCTSIIHPDDENFPSRPSSVSRSFEPFHLTSVRKSQQQSGRRLVFDQLNDFFPKHKYGKTATIVRTMWISIRMHSFIRQVVHSKFRRPDDNLHGPDTRASYMELTCIKITVWTADVMVRTCQALIWKLHGAKMRSFER